MFEPADAAIALNWAGFVGAVLITASVKNLPPEDRADGSFTFNNRLSKERNPVFAVSEEADVSDAVPKAVAKTPSDDSVTGKLNAPVFVPIVDGNLSLTACKPASVVAPVGSGNADADTEWLRDRSRK